MRTNVPEKLLKIADQIEKRGSVNLTRLTVLKKWCDQPYRLPSFAIFVANRASARKGKSSGETAEFFREARVLLAGAVCYRPEVPRASAAELHDRLRVFQDEYRRQKWGTVRVIKNKNLLLVEQGLDIYLWRSDSPPAGYRLGASYCEHYDSRCGNCLNGPSYTKIHEIARFMFNVEALEDLVTPDQG